MKTTFSHRHWNYKDSSRARKSLYHSLRVQMNKKNEWIDELTDGNCFLYHDGKKLNLASLNVEKRREFCEMIIDKEFGEFIPLETKQRHRQYKAKLTKKIKTEREKGNDFLAETLEKIKEDPSLDYTKMIDEIDGVKRKNQLLNMVKTYCSLANKCNGSPNKNESKIHEAYFKFPAKHGVTTKEASLDSMAKCLSDFYQKNFPDYPVRALVVHHDERTDVNDDGGAHPHVFVSTENAKTGERDLRRAMVAKINEHLKLKPVSFKYEWAEGDEIKSKMFKIEQIGDENMRLLYGETQIMGSILQDMFLDHLKNEYPDLDIDFTENRKRSYGMKCNQYADAKLNKSDREYNLNNLIRKKLDEATLELEGAQNTAKMQMEALERMEVVQEEMTTENRKLTNENDRLTSQYNEVNTKLVEASSELKEVKKELTALKTTLERIQKVINQSVTRALDFIKSKTPSLEKDNRFKAAIQDVKGAFLESKETREVVTNITKKIDKAAGNGCNNEELLKSEIAKEEPPKTGSGGTKIGI